MGMIDTNLMRSFDAETRRRIEAKHNNADLDLATQPTPHGLAALQRLQDEKRRQELNTASMLSNTTAPESVLSRISHTVTQTWNNLRDFHQARNSRPGLVREVLKDNLREDKDAVHDFRTF